MKKIFLCILAFFFILGCFFACSKPGSDVTTSGEESSDEVSKGDDEPISDDKNVTVNGKTASIENGDSKIDFEVANNRLFINSYSAEDVENIMSTDSEFVLPVKYMDGNSAKKFSWVFDSISKVSFSEKGIVSSGLSIKFTDGDAELNVICRYYIGKVGGPFEFQTMLTNGGNDVLRIQPLEFASFEIVAAKQDTLTYFARESGTAEGFTQSNGTTIASGKTGCYNVKLGDKKVTNVWSSTFQSWNSNGYLPVAYICRKAYVSYVALEWPAGRVNVSGDGSRNTITVDMDEISERKGKFVTNVPSGDTFVFPNVYFGTVCGDLDDVSNSLKRWFFNYKSPENVRENENEPLSQMDMQSGLDTHEIESIKWDYGWWDNKSRGTCGNWNAYEGSWVLRSVAYKNVLSSYGCSNMKRFGSTARAMDINWTVYLLLHDTVTAPGTPTAEEGEFNSITHPDWFSNRTIDKGMGASADLGNEECVAYLQKTMTNFFKNNNVGTWRSDFEPICYSSDKENRHDSNGTDVQYWCTVGFGELVSYVIDNVKGFRYESCCSGGGMKDLYNARYTTVFNNDDCGNYLDMRMTFYNTSYVIHPAQIQLIIGMNAADTSSDSFWPKPARGSMNARDYVDALYKMEFRSAIMAGPMLSSGIVPYPKDYWNYIDEFIPIYKEKVRPLIRYGDLYHILPRADGKNWDGIMYADPDSENSIKGCIFIFKPSEDAGKKVDFKLRGLDPEKTYDLSFDDHPELDMTETGSVLMNEGITVTIKDAIGSDIIWITESK